MGAIAARALLATTGSQPALPTGLSTDGTSFSFEPVAGATLHIVGVAEGSDESSVWGVAVLDGSTEVSLPAAVDLPDGTLRFGLQALEIPDLDVEDCAIDDLEDQVTRVSGDSVSFSR